MARSVLGICGGCQLGSSFSFLHTGFGSMTNMVSLGDKFFLWQRTWNIFIPHLPEPTGPAKFLLIVDGLQTFDVLPSSTEDSSTHRGQTADLLMCCPAGVPNFLRSIDASAIFLVGTHMIAELFS
ncbi:integrase_H2C2 domain-containing protein [Trichonephila clavipes]|nr:integrase_H2C2 domain-containing protein [Trichonephila clavipes]